jgi:hypothetical protein
MQACTLFGELYILSKVSLLSAVCCFDSDVLVYFAMLLWLFFTRTYIKVELIFEWKQLKSINLSFLLFLKGYLIKEIENIFSVFL